jgi:hypothetical protein
MYPWKCAICGCFISYTVDGSFDACKKHIKQYEEQKEAIKRKGYIRDIEEDGRIREDCEVVCPYCFYKPDPWYEILADDEDWQDIECGSCEKKFKAQLVKTYTITTKKDDSHD